MKKFVIACGGTGGHLSPGIAIAERLIQDGHQATLVVSDKNVDCRMLKKYPSLKRIVTHARPFSKNPVRFCKFIFSQVQSLFFAIKFLKNSDVDCVIGLGGFTNVPFILGGFLLKKKVVLHESNRVIGKSVRLLANFADKIYLPSGVNFRSRSLNKKVEHIGYPLRKELVRYEQKYAQKLLGIDTDKHVILVMGGSQGAKTLTNWALQNSDILNQRGIAVYCLTGMLNIRMGDNIFKDFSDNMSFVYSAADLVVSRAGAGTIAEVEFFNKPMILIPFPYAAGDHQTKNAQHVASNGRGDWLPEKQIHSLTKLVIQTLDMGRCGGYAHMAMENPVIKIVKDVTK